MLYRQHIFSTYPTVTVNLPDTIEWFYGTFWKALHACHEGALVTPLHSEPTTTRASLLQHHDTEQHCIPLFLTSEHFTRVPHACRSLRRRQKTSCARTGPWTRTWWLQGQAAASHMCTMCASSLPAHQRGRGARPCWSLFSTCGRHKPP